MEQAFQPVTVEDCDDLELLKEAAGKGALFIIRDPELLHLLQNQDSASLLQLIGSKKHAKSQPSVEEVRQHVSLYVKSAHHLATSQWRGKIAALWSKVLSDKDFLQLLMPTPKARKCRDFNKYSVMRLLGVMRSHGVYPEELRDVDFCNALEHSQGDNSYRSYLGQGIEDRALRKRLVSYIGDMTGG